MPEAFTQIVGGMAAPEQQQKYRTSLSPVEEYEFYKWVKQNNIPFQEEGGPLADYDMRGFWKAMQSGGAERAKNLHFPDTFKTPFHQSFSNESKYAGSTAPHWVDNKLVDQSGKVVFDESKR